MIGDAMVEAFGGKVDEIVQCPECNNTHLVRDYERGELVCDECGLVLEDLYLDQGPERHVFDPKQGEKVGRIGTVIGWKNKDSQGKSIPPKNQAQLFRIRRYHHRISVSSTTERNSAFALSELDRMVACMSVHRIVRETAERIYRKAVTKNLLCGRSIGSVVAAALYAACRYCKAPHTLDQIARASGVGRREIGRTYKFIRRELGLKLILPSPQDYISRFCDELKFTDKVKIKAIELLKQTDNDELASSGGAIGVAAAAVYFASILCNERRTQREVADVAGVAEVTIRHGYRKLMDKLLSMEGMR